MGSLVLAFWMWCAWDRGVDMRVKYVGSGRGMTDVEIGEGDVAMPRVGVRKRRLPRLIPSRLVESSCVLCAMCYLCSFGYLKVVTESSMLVQSLTL